ncbi:MAG: sulfurtransferase [Gallionellales bacterium CG08_land_8_20_14_0_20_59_87]|nr:MAG: sulfurtransferase [Gallionellales bacterium CG08_land_8_20_14_0_20_59_87]
MNEFRNISVSELPQLLAACQVQLVEVRARHGEAEPARGRIKGANSLPLHLLPLRLHELDRNKPTVFYCQMGGRSAQAAAFAAAQGHANVFNLQGGITAWYHAGGELEA